MKKTTKKKLKNIDKQLKKKIKLDSYSIVAIVVLVFLVGSIVFYFVGQNEAKNSYELQQHKNMLKEDYHKAMTYDLETVKEMTFKSFLITLGQYRLIILVVLAVILLIHGFKIIGR